MGRGTHMHTTGWTGVLTVCLLFVAGSDAILQDDSITFSKGLHFIEKFCAFGDTTYTKVTVNKLTPDADDVYLLMVEDEEWKKMWPKRNELTCEQMKNWLPVERREKFSRNVLPEDSPVELRLKNVQRPHFWYWAFLYCPKDGASPEKVTIDYHFMAQNPGWGGHFSHDEKGVALLYFLSMIVFALGLLYLLVLVKKIPTNSPMRMLLLLMIVAYVLQLLGLITYTANNFHLSETGRYSSTAEAFGFFFDVMSQLVFMLLCLLLAMGWAISITYIADKRPIIGVMGVFFILYMIVFIWEYTSKDPAATYYVYESTPAVVMLVVRCAIVLPWSLFLLRTTVSHEGNSSKKRFYYQHGLMFTAYLLSLPLIVLIATSIEPWVRAKTVESLYMVTTFLSFGIVAFWFWPTQTKKIMGGGAENQEGGETKDTGLLDVGAVSAYDRL